MGEKRRPGRPATGQVPVHSIRVGPVWDEAKAVAASRGERFSSVIEGLLRRYLAENQPADPAPRPPADYVPYGERKPYTVADSLDDLHGPTTGVVTLPHHLDWSGNATFDLDEPGVLSSVYETVLAEAAGVEDVNRWLDRDELIRLWPSMYLPAKVRRLWEERFPQLRAASKKAA